MSRMGGGEGAGMGGERGAAGKKGPREPGAKMRGRRAGGPRSGAEGESRGAPQVPAGGGGGGLSRADVSGFLASLEDFERRLDASRKTLEELSSQLGALARLSLDDRGGTEAVLPHLIEMHNHLASIHSSLADPFEGIRARYAELRARAADVTGECSRELEARRSQLDELWSRMEGAGRDAGRLASYVKEEKLLLAMSLDSYNRVLGTVNAMRDVESRVTEVFNAFSETIGRIDGISRAMSELISTDDSRALREELETLRKHRRERVSRYIW